MSTKRNRNRELPLKPDKKSQKIRRRNMIMENAKEREEVESGSPANDMMVDKFESVEDSMGFSVMKFSGDSVTLARKVKMLRALTASLGIVSQACVQAGVMRDTHYYWMKHDPVYNKAVGDTDEVSLDFAENALKKNIKSGNVIAQIFYLKTRGKRRGYIEQVKHVVGTGNEDNPFSGINQGGNVSAMKEEVPGGSLDSALQIMQEQG